MRQSFDLSKYNVSYDIGFVLMSPLKTLPSYFNPWNELAESLPKLMREKKVREAVRRLPLLDHSQLVGHRQLRLAHLQLSFITAGYVWQDGDKGVPQVLPKCVAFPFYNISKELGIQPILGHVDLALANYHLINPSGNLQCLYHIPGGLAGDWFCVVTFMLEFSFARCLKHLVRILDLLEVAHVQMRADEKGCKDTERKDNEREMAECLDDITLAVQNMEASLARMHDNLDAKMFFNVIRPFLGGWGGEGNALPDGLIYEGISDYPIKMPGGSAAQSTTLQILDALLGVEHTEDKRAFLVHMRSFMPPDHCRLIVDLEQKRPHKLRDLGNLILANDDLAIQELYEAYNNCVSALVHLRNYHIQIVTKYVIQASQTVNKGNYESLDKKGTGGTSLIPFLKDIRSDTQKKIMPIPHAQSKKSQGKLMSWQKVAVVVAITASMAVGAIKLLKYK
ncbi:unnamed protein product [Lymnaea stagnalis]|uniref:Indoleamine 2,3-dioxygenase 1 n=1 Tax=Lymnaea stagnalis TaxID=6523 RepID=A0AAV2I8W5_LYMST